MKKLSLIIGVLFPILSYGGTTDLTWTQPTKNVDGSPIGTLTNNTIYRGTKSDGSDLALLKVIPPAVKYTDATAVVGQNCYAVTAMTTLESAKSNIDCKTIPVPAPGAPTNLTVTNLTVYTIVKQTDRFVALPVGTIPNGTACDSREGATADGILYSAVPRAQVSWSGNVRPPVVVAKCG